MLILVSATKIIEVQLGQLIVSVLSLSRTDSKKTPTMMKKKGGIVVTR